MIMIDDDYDHDHDHDDEGDEDGDNDVVVDDGDDVFPPVPNLQLQGCRLFLIINHYNHCHMMMITIQNTLDTIRWKITCTVQTSQWLQHNHYMLNLMMILDND